MLILIISQEDELQVAPVSKVLRDRGHTPILFERYRRDHFITFSFSNETVQACLKINDKSYPLNSKTFPCVWSRMKPSMIAEIPGEESTMGEKFCAFEWKHALNSVEKFLLESKWVNPPEFNRIASLKPYQLTLAQEVGLLIPETIVTNDINQVKLQLKNGKAVYKTLSSFATFSDAIYTTDITTINLEDKAASIAMAPGIYQNLIEKLHELRITVIGNKLFTVKIDSQRESRTCLDWRCGPTKDMYSDDDLSPATKHKLLQFHQKAGLIYASYDFIIDKNGNEIFLECNPAGQWLSLDDSAESLCNALADELLTTDDCSKYLA